MTSARELLRRRPDPALLLLTDGGYLEDQARARSSAATSGA